MESIQDPFALFEQDIDIDLHSVFKQEAYNLLVRPGDTQTTSDELFTKVDNLLNVASEMLEYEAYIDIVSMALKCSGHDHMLEQILRESNHGAHADHSHDDDDEKAKEKKHNKRPLFRGGMFFKVVQPPAHKKSLYDILLGVK
jgi:hypothetical protein